MDRESFIFYRSFYEAIRCMPSDVQLEIYRAICEYALFGNLPKNLSEVAKGMYTLIKPNIDVNTTRFENGKKGGRKPSPKKPAKTAEAVYDLTYEQEVERMRADAKWRNIICSDFGITPEEYDSRLTRFLERCNEDKTRKGKGRHSSFVDCQSHLRYWMSKAYPTAQAAGDSQASADEPPFPDPDYTFNGGFGGIDV